MLMNKAIIVVSCIYVCLVVAHGQIVQGTKHGKNYEFLVCYSDFDPFLFVENTTSTWDIQLKCCRDTDNICYDVIYEEEINESIMYKSTLKQGDISNEESFPDFLQENITATNFFKGNFSEKFLFLTCYSDLKASAVSYKIENCSGIFDTNLICCKNNKCFDMIYEQVDELCHTQANNTRSRLNGNLPSEIEAAMRSSSSGPIVRQRGLKRKASSDPSVPPPSKQRWVGFINKTTDRCHNQAGLFYRIGFTQAGTVQTLIRICFRQADHRPLYSRHEIQGRNLGNSGREPWDHNLFCLDPEPLYRWSGLDRGHLAPVADFLTGNQDLTYYYINSAPQDPALNRLGWRLLEQDIRNNYFHNPVIFTGTFGTIGALGIDQVNIPKYFYKVYREDDNNNNQCTFAVALNLPRSLISINIFLGLNHFTAFWARCPRESPVTPYVILCTPQEFVALYNNLEENDLPHNNILGELECQQGNANPNPNPNSIMLKD